MNLYTNIAKLKTYLQIHQEEVTDIQDDHLFGYIVRASRNIESHTRRHFTPQRRTAWYGIPKDSSTLIVSDFDLLEVKGLSDRAGTRAYGVGEDSIQLRTGCEYNLFPKDNFQINPESGSTFNYSGVSDKQVKTDIITGYHTDYENAWLDTAGSLLSSVASSLSIIPVSASTLRDSEYRLNRYSEGDLLKIGEEYMTVTGSISASEIIVKRAVNGTSAASYAASANIYKWKPEYDIEFAATRLAAFAFTQESNPFGNRLAAPQFGVIEIGEDMPPDVKEKLKRFIRGRTISKLF